MAQKDYSKDYEQSTKLDLKEIKSKVVAFANQIDAIKDTTVVQGYLNYLCPTIEEKVAFVSMFDKTYPEATEIQALLSNWLDAEFAKYCNQSVVSKEIDKLKRIYQDVYGSSKPTRYERRTDVPYGSEKDQTFTLSAEQDPQNQEKSKHKFSLATMFGRLFGKDKSARVSKLSEEELLAARGGLRASQNQASEKDYNLEYRLQKYNERVAARAEMSRLSPMFEKDASVMSR